MIVEQIYEAISGWAGVPTWHTFHPLDEGRFNAAMDRLIDEVGTEITRTQFKEALRQHAVNNPPLLGEPTEWDEVIGQYADKAMAIVSYEGSR